MTLISTHRTILFADLADSTTIYEVLGDQMAARTIDHCLATMTTCVTQVGGVVVKTIGDEVMAAFGSAQAACEAAVAIQEQIDRLPLVGTIKHGVKIGLHAGPVLEERGDFWGDGVNIASRLTSLARRGQILASETAVSELPAAWQLRTRDLDAHRLKGKSSDVRVYEVQWADDLDVTHVVPGAVVARPRRLVVRRVDGTVAWSGEGQTLWLGRGADCGVVVQEITASRRHACIEQRQGKYVLVDESTNGTYLDIEGEREVFLRRESMPLGERGRIGLGVGVAAAAEPLAFECS